MNGPQHYAKAEEALGYYYARDMGDPREPVILAEAQVHATLALAAATAHLFLMAKISPDTLYGDREIRPDAEAWLAGIESSAAAAADPYTPDPPMLCIRCGEPLGGGVVQELTAGLAHVDCQLVGAAG